MAIYITKPWYKKGGGETGVYGIEWIIGTSSVCSRTDGAASFSDPIPYYGSISGLPSSPFDDISPWKDIQIVEDADAGTLVEIPKFYYKWTRNANAMKLQISNEQKTGFDVSPAHADRGDGVGERDYVYVGRYHCATADYKSKTGVKPKASITRATARTAISNLGADIWQMDYAMRWTINMLYLVEFADWDSQKTIGYGGGGGTQTANMGYTNSMGYHTGTNLSARATYGLGTQYRFIEGLWDNVYDFVDGIYFNADDIYAIKNPSQFSDSSGGTLVGKRATSSGYISGWTNPSVSGFEYFLYPNAVESAESYVCDNCDYAAAGVTLSAGGNYGRNKTNGAFYLRGDGAASATGAGRGCRLMVLPPSRLTA